MTAATIYDIQYKLQQMGLYAGELDGIVGPLTIAAIDSLLPADIAASNAAQTAGDFWDKIEYFRKDEPGIACPCCGLNNMTYGVMHAADIIRKRFGAPATPSSGTRCKRHNAEVGGVANSKHLTGEALDFCVAGSDPDSVVSFAYTVPGVKYAYSITSGGRATGYVHINT